MLQTFICTPLPPCLPVCLPACLPACLSASLPYKTPFTHVRGWAGGWVGRWVGRSGGSKPHDLVWRLRSGSTVPWHRHIMGLENTIWPLVHSLKRLRLGNGISVCLCTRMRAFFVVCHWNSLETAHQYEVNISVPRVTVNTIRVDSRPTFWGDPFNLFCGQNIEKRSTFLIAYSEFFIKLRGRRSVSQSVSQTKLKLYRFCYYIHIENSIMVHRHRSMFVAYGEFFNNFVEIYNVVSILCSIA